MEATNNVSDGKVLDDEEIFSEEPCSPTKKDNEKCSGSSKGINRSVCMKYRLGV